MDWAKIEQLGDKSKKPLEEKVFNLGIVESKFVASLMTKSELEAAITKYEAKQNANDKVQS